jgi:hypothetical protein
MEKLANVLTFFAFVSHIITKNLKLILNYTNKSKIQNEEWQCDYTAMKTGMAIGFTNKREGKIIR